MSQPTPYRPTPIATTALRFSIYLDLADHPLGFLNFAPAEPARGAMFSARSRLKAGGETKVAVPVSEEELYDRG